MRRRAQGKGEAKAAVGVGRPVRGDGHTGSGGSEHLVHDVVEQVCGGGHKARGRQGQRLGWAAGVPGT